MNSRIVYLIGLALPLFIGCGNNNTQNELFNGTVTSNTKRPLLVQSANGSFLSLECLQGQGASIASAAQQSLEQAQQLAQQCDVSKLSSSLRGIACAPTIQIGVINWNAYYYPPTYYNGGNNYGFDNYLFGGYTAPYSGLQILGYNPGYTYNPYPVTYQPYPYSYSTYNPYANPAAYGTYYNPAPSTEFCNTSCFGNAAGYNYNSCANSCWFNTQF